MNELTHFQKRAMDEVRDLIEWTIAELEHCKVLCHDKIDDILYFINNMVMSDQEFDEEESNQNLTLVINNIGSINILRTRLRRLLNAIPNATSVTSVLKVLNYAIFQDDENMHIKWGVDHRGLTLEYRVPLIDDILEEKQLFQTVVNYEEYSF